MKTFVSALLLGAILATGTATVAEAKTHKTSAAKKKCLEENPDMKGKALKACIKRNKKSS